MRIWLKRIILAVLLLTGLYLLGINLFLNTPLATRAFNRRPHRFQIHWHSAWTVWPGLVHTRGLKVEGWRPNVAWSITAERARGWVDLGSLAGRTLRIRDLQGEEVRSTVIRRPGVGRPDPPRRPGERQQDARRQPWTMTFEGIVLDHVREFRFNQFRLTGDGRAEGAFWFVMGGNFRLEPSTARLPVAQLWMGSDVIAQNVDLTAGANMGPYRVRDHLGLEGFDFLSGSLKARGRVPELPFLEQAGLPGAEGRKPGALLADLRVEQGRLQPGSRFDVTAPANGSSSPFILTTAVGEAQEGARLRLRLDARGFSAGRQKHGPPLFRSKVLAVTSMTPETRLSRIFATARNLRAHDPVSLPLEGDVRAEGVQIEAPGTRAVLRATFDRGAGRVDLPGLLARDIEIQDLIADGISARLDLVKTPPPPPEETVPITVRIANARFSHVREVSLGQYLLAGDLQAETTFSYLPDGTLTVDRAALAMPAGTFRVAGQPAAQNLFLKVETRIEPSILGKTVGLAFLRYVSGTASLRSRINSLGFLEAFFQKTPWLSLQGQGRLDADVRLDHGKLTPGTRISVNASPVRAKVFDSLATGLGTVNASVSPGKTGPLTTLHLRFDRFGLEDLRRKGRPDYLRGRGLRISAAAPGALDLTAPPPDFDATIDMQDAEVPDLAVYDALLPDQAGLAVTGGRGRARLHLEVSTATRKARGNATLTSDDARVQLQNLLLQGNLAVTAPLMSPDLDSRKFDLRGIRLTLDGVSYRDVAADAPAEPTPWWAHAAIESGSLVWGAPLSLRGQGKVDMKNAGPLLTLFSQRSRVLRWFDDVLNVENVTARGTLRMGDGVVEIESLQATGGSLEVRSRMIFSKDRRLGDLYLRYGRLAAGVELRDGQRNLKLRRPLDWYESRRGAWP